MALHPELEAILAEERAKIASMSDTERSAYFAQIKADQMANMTPYSGGERQAQAMMPIRAKVTEGGMITGGSYIASPTVKPFTYDIIELKHIGPRKIATITAPLGQHANAFDRTIQRIIAALAVTESLELNHIELTDEGKALVQTHFSQGKDAEG